MRFVRRLLCVLPVLGVVSTASAQVFWDEEVNGDLSNDRMAPTAFSFGVGVHSLRGLVGNRNLDYMSITIPAGTQFSELRLAGYEGADNIAFAAIMAGPQFTEGPDQPPFNMLGWTHFGPGMGNVGTSILDDMGFGSGAIGFEPPLPANTYSFWIQQLGGNVTYQWDFVIIPGPSGAAMVAVAGGGADAPAAVAP